MDNTFCISPEEILKKLKKGDPGNDTPEQLTSDNLDGIKYEFLKERLEGEKQYRNQRKEFAGSIFTAVMVYLFLTVLILLACGCLNSHLSDTVLVALLTTASANVIGTLLVVVRYLFHHR